MLHTLLALMLLGNGDGSGILPLTSCGGTVNLVVTANPDGTFSVTGKVWGISVIGWGIGVWKDGRFQAECCPIYCDGDMLIRMGTPVPLKLTIDANPDDGCDGDPLDDNGGAFEVRSQTGAGRGWIDLKT
jgi:hypothetical protein